MPRNDNYHISPGDELYDQERDGFASLSHDNRKPKNTLAMAFAGVVVVCLSALLLAGTAALVLWILGVEL